MATLYPYVFTLGALNVDFRVYFGGGELVVLTLKPK